ncbi:hypothetical protein, partial [Paraburkholderia sp. XV]|uniref:hypothetical protein n=1 Tax=Paraburkholderia sp. XV TaxID=2831520 RepID=UPI001CD50642
PAQGRRLKHANVTRMPAQSQIADASEKRPKHQTATTHEARHQTATHEPQRKIPNTKSIENPHARAQIPVNVCGTNP